DSRLIGQQGCRHGRGMRRHARTEIEGDAIEMIARSGRTIRSAFLEAGDVRIAVVPAARALGEVAAERCKMTDLRRGKSKRCSRNARISRSEAAIGGERGNRRKGADARGAVG